MQFAYMNPGCEMFGDYVCFVEVFRHSLFSIVLPTIVFSAQVFCGHARMFMSVVGSGACVFSSSLQDVSLCAMKS